MMRNVGRSTVGEYFLRTADGDRDAIAAKQLRKSEAGRRVEITRPVNEISPFVPA